MKLRVLGLHMVSNALAALAVADAYGVDLHAAAAKLEEFEGYRGRQQIYEVRGVTVVDDSYNASPASMKAGLQVLESLKPGARKIAILADMKGAGARGGAFSPGDRLLYRGASLNRVVLMGELAREIGRGILEKGGNTTVEFMENLDQVKEFLRREAREGDCILFKRPQTAWGLGEAAAWFRGILALIRVYKEMLLERIKRTKGEQERFK